MTFIPIPLQYATLPYHCTSSLWSWPPPLLRSLVVFHPWNLFHFPTLTVPPMPAFNFHMHNKVTVRINCHCSSFLPRSSGYTPPPFLRTTLFIPCKRLLLFVPISSSGQWKRLILSLYPVEFPPIYLCSVFFSLPKWRCPYVTTHQFPSSLPLVVGIHFV